MNRYSFDPGGHHETGFWYPEEWNDKLGNWPSAEGLQPQNHEQYVKPEDLGKKHHWLTDGEDYFYIFADEDEFSEYMRNNPHVSHPVVE